MNIPKARNTQQYCCFYLDNKVKTLLSLLVPMKRNQTVNFKNETSKNKKFPKTL